MAKVKITVDQSSLDDTKAKVDELGESLSDLESYADQVRASLERANDEMDRFLELADQMEIAVEGAVE